MTTETYESFLSSKAPTVPMVGFEPGPFTRGMFPWQEAVVARALRAGRHALFEDCGLGKSLQSLEWARQVATHTGGRVLVLAPLAVAHQFVREGQKFGLPCEYAKSQAEASGPVVITNYERLDSFNPDDFSGVVLDESSILKNFDGATTRALIEAFSRTPFRMACTATPSPNDTTEFATHAEFLGIMPRMEMLARWFVHDSGDTGTYRLKGHAEDDFWRWVASWAVATGKPSDILDANGQPYSDAGYVLPPLTLVEHVVSAEGHGPTDGQLFRHVNASATTLHRELRASMDERVAKMAEIVRAEPGEAWLLWVTTNDEADALRAALPEAVEVRGSMPSEEKARLLNAFALGDERILITKGGIAGFGMNYQHCARIGKLASNFSFEEFYQEVRRCWRFGQTREVKCHVICASGEERIRAVVAAKQEAHRVQRQRMVAAQRELRMDELAARRAEVGDGYIRTENGDGWMMHHGDCVEVTRDRVASNSVGLTLFSPPFSSLYVYSASLRDMGNCRNDAEFFEQFRHLVGELLRVTKPGRLCVIHTMDIPTRKGVDGYMGLRAFPDECLRLFESYVPPDGHAARGFRWRYHSRITIWKNPVSEMQRTKSHGLLYKTVKTNATNARQGLADYLIVLRKTGDVDAEMDRVTHTPEDFDLDTWQRYASPVWFDINQQRVLNAVAARTDKDERHLAPLQLDVIERCVRLWTNPGDTVFSPFAGIGSEGHESLRLGRKFEGVELKKEYFGWACRNLAGATAQGSLFGDVA